MTEILSTNAYAKINLFLDVLNKRRDNYHNIESVMQSVSLCDNITVTSHGCPLSSSIEITCTDASIPTDERNIVYKCASAFFRHFEIDKYNISIHIDKRIMAEAGLAGGSSDGAAVLHILNKIFHARADLNELCQIGAKVGADIPFCLTGGTCLVRGIGEIIIPLEIPFPKYRILIAFPRKGVSTADAYNMIDKIPNREIKSPNETILALKNGKIPKNLHNIFEKSVFPYNKEAESIKSAMYEYGAVSAMMSGSGPSVFGLFEDETQCMSAKIKFEERKIKVFACAPTH